MTLAFGTQPRDRHACSRAGCNETALYAIFWRNPKIHGVERRKTWLACDRHLEYLREFLAARGFPLTVSSIEEVIRAESDAGHRASE